MARFKQEPFDLVLTDQKMPDFSGLGVLEGVRAITSETAVIVMTACGTNETAVSAIKAGAADYLTKPVNLDELLRRIQQVQERQRRLTDSRELRDALVGRHLVEGIIGESSRMREVLSLVRRVRPQRAVRAGRRRQPLPRRDRRSSGAGAGQAAPRAAGAGARARWLEPAAPG